MKAADGRPPPGNEAAPEVPASTPRPESKTNSSAKNTPARRHVQRQAISAAELRAGQALLAPRWSR